MVDAKDLLDHDHCRLGCADWICPVAAQFKIVRSLELDVVSHD
jgi:hypothetical protein